MSDLLPLNADELLSTTRAVRKRLDLTRPVERSVIEECLTIAQQAPSGSNRQGWHFMVVTDPAKRLALADLYRTSWTSYRNSGGPQRFDDPELQAVQSRVASSSQYLAEHFHEVPVFVIPCISGRTEGKSIAEQAGTWGSILPATWNFMLAARARGLGTVWTTLHLVYEKEAAEVLGIPYDKIMQAALIPVAYTLGTDFQPGPRRSLEDSVHWDQW